MAKKKWGRIVNLGSIGENLGEGKEIFLFTLKVYLEFFLMYKKWKQNVFVNTIRVGLQTQNYIKNYQKKFIKEELIPIKRMANSEEIAKLYFYRF